MVERLRNWPYFREVKEIVHVMLQLSNQNKIRDLKDENRSLKKLGSVLVHDFWTPPPPINFVHGY